MSEETEIVIPANMPANVVTFAAALPAAVVALGLGLYVLIFPDAMGPPSGPILPFLPPAASQAVLMAAVTIGFTTWFAARGFGALLRALDQRPMLVADLDGLRFDPTLCREPIAWSDVRRIRRTIVGKGPNKLVFDLRRRIWATESPLTARQIGIGGLHLDNVGRVPHNLVDRLEALRLRASRGPDADG